MWSTILHELLLPSDLACVYMYDTFYNVYTNGLYVCTQLPPIMVMASREKHYKTMNSKIVDAIA